MNKSVSILWLLFSVAVLSCHNESHNEPADKKVPAKKNIVDSAAKMKTIVFFGNSLTAGYGVGPSDAYPALIQNKIDSLKLNYRVINAGVSGETSSGGLGRIDWVLRQKVDVFVLELGGNDGLRGIPISTTIKNLQAIIDKVKAKYPDVKILLEGMQIPPNLGQQYTMAFKNIYPDLAARNHIALVPFLLKNVGGNPKLNQQDGIHPTAEGHKIVAQNVWAVLKNLLQ
jgi:acyl-CoA thioesterase I